MPIDLERRRLLRIAAAGAVLPIGGSALAAAPARLSIEAVVIDTRLPAAIAAAAPGVLRLRTDGDVTKLWYDRLDLAWRAPGGMLAGTTGEDILFVLETLAHDRGRKVVRRMAAGDGAVRWLIGMRG
jgi:hypothetical protein